MANAFQLSILTPERSVFEGAVEYVHVPGTEGYLGVLTKQDPAAAKNAYDAVASRTGMGRWGKVHEIAYPCIFLASEAAAFMTGATIIVDGGPSAREGDEAS